MPSLLTSARRYLFRSFRFRHSGLIQYLSCELLCFLRLVYVKSLRPSFQSRIVQCRKCCQRKLSRSLWRRSQ